MGNFVTDKKRGEIAENIVIKMLSSEYPDRNFKQINGKFSDYDIIEDSRRKNKLTIEVKFDIKASSTGNLCFEFTNGSKPTGICKSKAKEIRYVLKTSKKKEFIVLTFDRTVLLEYLLYQVSIKNKKIKIKFGGDGYKFGLILCKIQDILDDNVGIKTLVSI